MTEHTAWAVIRHGAPYHPAGDKSQTKTEFTYWVFETQQQAARYKAARLILGHDFNIEVRKVNEESWDTLFGPKKVESKPEKVVEEAKADA